MTGAADQEWPGTDTGGYKVTALGGSQSPVLARKVFFFFFFFQEGFLKGVCGQSTSMTPPKKKKNSSELIQEKSRS